jgi:starch synthase
VPEQAFILDWVFADGPPRKAEVYDNNALQDFHATVPDYMSEELFWFEEEHRICRKLQEARKINQEAARRKVCFIEDSLSLYIYIYIYD